MPNKSCFSIIILLIIGNFAFSQTPSDTTIVDIPKEIIVAESVVRKPIDPLAPAKAAFFSAVLPGLGQAYNKKYWKIPIVYAAMGAGIYFYIDNDKEYDRYRDAYKRRLAGFNDDEFYGTSADGNPLSTPRVSTDGLIRAQKSLKRNKELSLLITIGIYALNIIDANVDAHLLQFNVDENLALQPHFQYNEKENSTDLGLTLNFKF